MRPGVPGFPPQPLSWIGWHMRRHLTLIILLLPAVLHAQQLVDLSAGEAAAVLTGDEATRVGQTVVLGDLDGDTTLDLAVGSPGAAGPLGDRFSGGAVYVYFDVGSLSGELPAPDAADFTLWGAVGDADGLPPFEGDELGHGVLVADLDGDTVGDLVASAPGADLAGPPDRTDAGVVVVLYGPLGPGSLDLSTDAPDHRIWGAGNGDCLGSSVSCVGSALAAADIDGADGLELVVGAPEADGEVDGKPRSGEVWILTFTPPPPATVDLGTVTGAPHLRGGSSGDLLGASFAAADLLGGDGLQDLAVGAPGADGPGDSRGEAGGVFLLDACCFLPFPVDLMAGVADVTLHGARPGDAAGSSLTTLDWDGDTAMDLAVGAPGGDGPGPSFQRGNSGQVHVVWFSPSPPPNEADLASFALQSRIFGPRTNDGLGESLAGGRLVPGAGDSLTVGVPFYDGLADDRRNAGGVFGLAGRPSRPPFVDLRDQAPELVVMGASEGDRAGVSVAVGKVCGGGSTDLIVGAPLADGPNRETLAGRVEIVCDLVPNQPPVAVARIAPFVGCASGGTASVFFDGSESSDPEGDMVAWRWYRDSVMPANLLTTGETASFDLAAGAHTIVLEVEDAGGQTDTDTATVVVEDAPEAAVDLRLAKTPAQEVAFTWTDSICADTHRIFRGDLDALPAYDHATPFSASTVECSAASGVLVPDEAVYTSGTAFYYLVGGVQDPAGTNLVGGLGAADEDADGQGEVLRPRPGQGSVTDGC